MREDGKKYKKGTKKSVSKVKISEFGKTVEKYNLINNLAQAQTGISFGHIASGGRFHQERITEYCLRKNGQSYRELVR